MDPKACSQKRVRVRDFFDTTDNRSIEDFLQTCKVIAVLPITVSGLVYVQGEMSAEEVTRAVLSGCRSRFGGDSRDYKPLTTTYIKVIYEEIVKDSPG